MQDTYVKPSRDQLRKALVKSEVVFDFIEKINSKLRSEKVIVKSLFGLKKKEMSKHAHIKKKFRDSFISYYKLAWCLDYISLWEELLCERGYDVPRPTVIKNWLSMEEVFLNEYDAKKLHFILDLDMKDYE